MEDLISTKEIILHEHRKTVTFVTYVISQNSGFRFIGIWKKGIFG